MKRNIFLLLILCIISLGTYAQAESYFSTTSHGKIKISVQKTLPAYIENNVIKGNINSTFGKSGNACEYDRDGIKLRQIYDDGETRFSIEYKYQYIKKHISVQECYTNSPSNVLWKKNIFTYDAKGKHVIELTTVSASGDTLEQTQFYYSNNSLTKEVYSNHKSPSDKYISEYTYDLKQTKPSKIKYYTLSNEEKKLGSISTFTYDDHLNEIVQESYDDTGNLTSTTTNKYVYDTKGNWTRKETSVDGEIYSLTEKEYTYY